MDKSNPDSKPVNKQELGGIHKVTPIGGMYKNWFLEYASYVILERAIPAIEDGLKPVQRRILHAMHTMDDGRYNKVANIVGQTMQYHPHGDASITDALVGLGQKDLLIDTQGNWGDVRTGDSAAAARYIEARIAPFAHDILYSPKITDWQLSYDGRKKEPITLPVKFPLLLAQGVEGIAVGLSTKILPHNFIELIEAAIAVLQGKEIAIFPDFSTGGLIDCTAYNEGAKGSRVRIRAEIIVKDKQTLAIKNIPYGTTTTSLIDSILKAHEKGKLKIKNVVDNTAATVEILIHIAPRQSPTVVKDALYVFTDCEVSMAPNACVIIDEKPTFLGVNEILAYTTRQTKKLLEKELTLTDQTLQEKILFTTLEQLFIEKKIYRTIENCTTWEGVITTIEEALHPYLSQLYRAITREDIIQLTEIKIKRISKYSALATGKLLASLQDERAQVVYDLQHLNNYAIQYYKKLLKKYGAGRERKTTLSNFDTIQAHEVAINNQKLYMDRKKGFIGYGLKEGEQLGPCSDLDDVIVFNKNGSCLVTKITDKVFVGKDIIHAAVFKKNDTRRCYNIVYIDGATGIAKAKRFQMIGITRDKTYDLTMGSEGSRILYFTDNAHSAAEVIQVLLSPSSRSLKKKLDFDFNKLAIKGRNSQGNILTKHPIYKIKIKEQGKSTLGGLTIWYDDTVGKLNTANRGKCLGEFQDQDRILLIFKQGAYMLTNYQLINTFDPEEVFFTEKFDTTCPISIIYYDAQVAGYFVKRFSITTKVLDKKFNFLPPQHSYQLVTATTSLAPQVTIHYRLQPDIEEEQSILYPLNGIAIKGYKANGVRLCKYWITQITLDKEVSTPIKIETVQNDIT